MFVRPFALTMRLAANMTGGHVAVLAVLAMIFIMAESARSAIVGLGMAVVAVPLAVGISVLEAVVVVPGAGIRVHTIDGRVRRHGHSRSSLSMSTGTAVRRSLRSKEIRE